MQAKINSTLLGKLKPENRPYEVYDLELKGFILRVQPSGIMTFICSFRMGRRRTRVTLGRHPVLSPAQARDAARRCLADLVRGDDPTLPKKEAKAHTLKSFVEEVYEPWLLANRKSGRATVARLKSCFAEFMPKRLADINPWLLEKWRTGRLKSGTKPVTVNRDVSDLKAALTRAAAWGFLDAHPLVAVIPVKEESSPIVRFLDQDEETRLRDALVARDTQARAARERNNMRRRARGWTIFPSLGTPFIDYLHPMVLLSLNTGLRQGEAVNLCWADVDLDRAVLTVRAETAKAGRARHVPLNAEAMRALTAWREETDSQGLVFPGQDNKRLVEVKRAWANLLRSAKIENFRWHDMRHHFASRLVMAGVDLNTVRELMGHADLKMTIRYAHLAPEHKAAAVARLVENREVA